MGIASTRVRRFVLLAFALGALAVAAAPAAADDTHIRGFITQRLDTGFTMQSEEDASLIVSIVETTQIKLKDGTHMPASDLTPGLRVEVEGIFDGNSRLVAQKIHFTESDLKLARAINAGLVPADQKINRNTFDIQQHGTTLGEHGEALQAHRRDLSDHEMRIVATSGAIDTTNTRIGNLDDFLVVDTLTVYFKNGSAALEQEYVDQLEALAMKAKLQHGYMLQVQGYASAVGPRPINEELSAKRANAVVAALQQHGGVPPTNVLVPAAMGISEQVAENNTREGQAQNRRVVVTILQNKGIAEK